MYTGEQPIVGLTAAQQQDQYKTAAAMMNGYSHVPADVTCSPFGPRRWRR
jgi:hypothetical protein